MWLLTSQQRLIKICLWSALFVAVTLFPPAAKAQEQRGLEISPFLIDLNVPKGGSIESQIEVANRGSETLRFAVVSRDFLPGDNGQPAFVPDEQIQDHTFSLSSWINLQSPAELTLAPGQSSTVRFSVSPPANTEDGTHYGAILFTLIDAAAAPVAGQVQQSVGTILLVSYGQPQASAELRLQPKQTIFWTADTVEVGTLFSNTGNGHVRPKGEIYFKNLFGQTVGSAFVNRDAASVLPKTERQFASAWLPSWLSFGPYTAEAVVIYGQERLEIRDQVVIWILPWYLIAAGIVFLAVLLWLIISGRPRYKRWVIKRYLGENSLTE
jgi:hypothetical protein